MQLPVSPSRQRIFYLASGFVFGTAVLRSVVAYGPGPQIGPALGLLSACLMLFLLDALLAGRGTRHFPVYVALQTLLIFALLWLPDASDFYAILFAVLGMQLMQRAPLRPAVLCVALFTPLMFVPLANLYGIVRAIAFALIYTAANALLASYALAARRAEEARARSRALAGELEAANLALEAHLARARQLAAAQERHHLARELHDSATQTVFSMVLAAQSASLLLERDPAAVGPQLDRLGELAQNALAELRALISELRPERLAGDGLLPALRQLLAGPEFAGTLSVDLQVEGDARLAPREEENLFRIAAEALKNIVKHAGVPRASVRLHLVEPFWMEIEDRGRGYQLEQARAGGHIGLSVMSERAAEIGWELQIVTSPGTGTRVRAEKKPPEEGGR